jgi:hypothetical protein
LWIPPKRIAAILVLIAVLGLAILAGYRLGRRGGTRRSAGNAPCVDIHEAAKHVGEDGCVAGRVVRVYTSRAGNTFLDFCPDYRQCPFTTVIFAKDRSKFGDLETLQGRWVEIRGPIVPYRDRPEIIIHDPDQVHVVP